MLRTPLVAQAQKGITTYPYAATSGSSPMPKLSEQLQKLRLGMLPPTTPETSICAIHAQNYYVVESLLFIKYITTVA